MSLLTQVRWSLVSIATAVRLPVFIGAQAPAPAGPAKDAKPVTVQDLEKQVPIGHLGVPLGTVVRVSGEVLVIPSNPQLQAVTGGTFLRVKTVDFKELAQPVDFLFESGQTYDGQKLTLKNGEKFDFSVCESGVFGGYVRPPPEFERPALASPDFRYRRFLDIFGSYPKPKTK